MRKLILIFIAVAYTIPVISQQTWKDKYDELNELHYDYVDKEDWRGAVSAMDKMHKVFMAQPDSVRIAANGEDDLSGNFYYNLACYRTLAGDKKGAIKTFKHYTDRVIGNEEINLSHISTDTDLDAIRSNKEFEECMKRLRKWGDYKQKLKDAGQYVSGVGPIDMKFKYASPNDSNLVKLREKFNLDSIAGAGDEISKIKNLLHWVHEVVPHDGSSDNPKIKNTISMIELCRKENRGVNCRMMAQMLAEVYLAMGFKARFVTCLPLDMVSDCHVITCVYSCTLDKWLWVDPTFDAYVMDENGTMLSIAEVRERLRQDKELQINDYANWNHKTKQTKEYYIDRYMAKNLYFLSCMEWSRFDAETSIKGREYRYITLMPYNTINSKSSSVNWYEIRTCDDKWFWQSPYEQ